MKARDHRARVVDPLSKLNGAVVKTVAPPYADGRIFVMVAEPHRSAKVGEMFLVPQGCVKGRDPLSREEAFRLAPELKERLEGDPLEEGQALFERGVERRAR